MPSSATARRLMLLVALLAQCAERVAGRMLAPMKRRTALNILNRLAEGSDDTISMDIGGTLAKVVLFQPQAEPPADGEAPTLDLGEASQDKAFNMPDQLALSVYVPCLKGNLHFFVFETRQMTDVVGFISKHWPQAAQDLEAKRPITLRATGGGAVKHADSLRTAGVRLVLEEEMAAMMTGLDYLLRHIPGELFAVDMDALGSWTPLATPAQNAKLARSYVDVPTPPADYLYVSIGSGISILEVHTDTGGGGGSGVTRYRRVGGSSVGGSTFWGLVRLLTSCSTFDEVIRLTEAGSSSNVDMLVGDIYGGNCDAIGLNRDVIAASFGKVTMQREEDRAVGPMFFFRYIGALLRHYEEGFWLILLAVLNSIPGIKHFAKVVGLVRWAEQRAASVAMCGNFRAHDVALSLLRMVSNNIGHIACMCAQQYSLPHIVFGGSFIRDHPYTIATISSGVRFYSRGAVQANFLKHDGFVGAVGAHVAGVPPSAIGHSRLERMGTPPPGTSRPPPDWPDAPPPSPQHHQHQEQQQYQHAMMMAAADSARDPRPPADVMAAAMMSAGTPGAAPSQQQQQHSGRGSTSTRSTRTPSSAAPTAAAALSAPRGGGGGGDGHLSSGPGGEQSE